MDQPRHCGAISSLLPTRLADRQAEAMPLLFYPAASGRDVRASLARRAATFRENSIVPACP
jgi:hypothetical protein